MTCQTLPPKPSQSHLPSEKTAGLHDPWADWAPQWEGSSPHVRQERRAPTRRSSEADARRRIVDARLWEAMSTSEQVAAAAIAFSFERMSRGIGFASSDWTRIPGARGHGNGTEEEARLITIYTDWATACARQKISHAMVLDVLCFGHACRTVDRNRRLKNGTARENLMLGLQLYCKIRGWG